MIKPVSAFAQEETQASASAEISNENSASVTTDASLDAITGQNSALGEGTEIGTATASASVTVENSVNINVTGENTQLLVLNETAGGNKDVSLDPGSEGTASESGQLTGSFTASNIAEVINNVDITAVTGENVADGQGSGIATGNAEAEINVVNLVNLSLSGNNWYFGILNLFEAVEGDIILPYDLMYLDLTGATRPAGPLDFGVGQGNEAQIQDLVNVNAVSGDNTTADGAAIRTGQIDIVVNIINTVNTNISGSNWLLLEIRNLGQWDGQLIGWWGNYMTSGGSLFAWIRLPETGQSSASQQITSENKAVVENNVNIQAVSGHNSAAGSGTSVNTGSIGITANIVNIINTNISGHNWYFSQINIFDKLLGNIIFPRPDLSVWLTSTTHTYSPAGPIMLGIHYRNTGRAPARNTALKLVNLSTGTETVWLLGTIGPGEFGRLIFEDMAPAQGSGQISFGYLASIRTTDIEFEQGNNQSYLSLTVAASPPENIPAGQLKNETPAMETSLSLPGETDRPNPIIQATDRTGHMSRKGNILAAHVAPGNSRPTYKEAASPPSVWVAIIVLAILLLLLNIYPLFTSVLKKAVNLLTDRR